MAFLIITSCFAIISIYLIIGLFFGGVYIIHQFPLRVSDEDLKGVVFFWPIVAIFLILIGIKKFLWNFIEILSNGYNLFLKLCKDLWRA